MKKIETFNDVVILVDDKVDGFVDTMIDDVKDIVKESFPELNENESWGVLPEEFNELKSKMKVMISDYIHGNVIQSTLEKQLV
jgi:hypothetical protein